MWTVVWVDANDVDHYERCDRAEDVLRVLEENHLKDDVNVLIFPPDSEYDVDAFVRLHG